MRLSIIVPVYNGARYLKTLFDCLNAQTCTDYEAVFVDDGSTDDTREQYRILAKAYPRVHSVLYAKPNGGVSSARNLGIEKATGDAISFCDVDDLLPPCYVDYILRTLQETGSDFVYWQFVYCKQDISRKEEVKPLVFSVLDKEKVLKENLFKAIVLCCGSCAVKADVIRLYGLRYNETSKYSEDSNFIWKMLCASRSVVSIENVLYYYIIHSDSAMGRFDKDRVDGYRIALDLLDFVYKTTPDFAPLYERYEGPRLLWSMAWQAAQRLNRKDFYRYFEELPLTDAMRTLCTYPRKVTMLSAKLYRVSPDLFRLSSKAYGCLLSLKNLGRG